MIPLLHRSSIRPLALSLVVFAIIASGCTKPVTTNVAPPAVASLTADQEVVGLILKDGTEQLFDIGSPKLQNDEWVGTEHGQTVRVPASDVQEVVVQEQETDVLAIGAIVAMVGIAIAAIAIASPQR